MRVGLEGQEDKIQTLVASLESVWGGMLWAIEVALAAGLWKGQCAKWGLGRTKVAPFQGLWAGRGWVPLPSLSQPVPREQTEMREMVTKVRHRERVTQVITFFSFHALY